jgi:hypothetical protein
MELVRNDRFPEGHCIKPVRPVRSIDRSFSTDQPPRHRFFFLRFFANRHDGGRPSDHRCIECTYPMHPRDRIPCNLIDCMAPIPPGSTRDPRLSVRRSTMSDWATFRPRSSIRRSSTRLRRAYEHERTGGNERSEIFE